VLFVKAPAPKGALRCSHVIVGWRMGYRHFALAFLIAAGTSSTEWKRQFRFRQNNSPTVLVFPTMMRLWRLPLGTAVYCL